MPKDLKSCSQICRFVLDTVIPFTASVALCSFTCFVLCCFVFLWISLICNVCVALCSSTLAYCFEKTHYSAVQCTQYSSSGIHQSYYQSTLMCYITTCRYSSSLESSRDPSKLLPLQCATTKWEELHKVHHQLYTVHCATASTYSITVPQ